MIKIFLTPEQVRIAVAALEAAYAATLDRKASYALLAIIENIKTELKNQE